MIIRHHEIGEIQIVLGGHWFSVHQLCSKYELWVSEAQHLPKKYNTLCDSLSRKKTVKGVGISDKFDLKLETVSILLEVVTLCNPTTDMLSHNSIYQLWTHVTAIISRLPPL